MVLDPVEWVGGSLEVKVGAQVVWGPGRLMEGPRLVICNMVYVLDNAFCTQ